MVDDAARIEFSNELLLVVFVVGASLVRPYWVSAVINILGLAIPSAFELVLKLLVDKS